MSCITAFSEFYRLNHCVISASLSCYTLLDNYYCLQNHGISNISKSAHVTQGLVFTNMEYQLLCRVTECDKEYCQHHYGISPMAICKSVLTKATVFTTMESQFCVVCKSVTKSTIFTIIEYKLLHHVTLFLTKTTVCLHHGISVIASCNKL